MPARQLWPFSPRAGVTPLDAAEAEFAREGYDLSGFDPDYEGYDEEDASGQTAPSDRVINKPSMDLLSQQEVGHRVGWTSRLWRLGHNVRLIKCRRLICVDLSFPRGRNCPLSGV